MSETHAEKRPRKRRKYYLVGIITVALIIVIGFTLKWEYTPMDPEFKQNASDVYDILNTAMDEVRDLNDVEQKTVDMFFAAYKDEYENIKKEYLEEGYEDKYNAYIAYNGLFWMRFGLEGYLENKDEESMEHFIKGKEICVEFLDV